MYVNDTEVLQQLLNVTQSLQEQRSVKPDLLTSITPVIVSLTGSILLMAIFMMPTLKQSFAMTFQVRRLIKQMSKVTGRKVIIMSHKNSGIFGSMISMEDVVKIERAIRQSSNKDIDLIVNTFGGDLLASLRLATLIKRQNIRVFVPKYAWSGGSLAAVSSNHLFMNEDATLSPVDPQLGNLLNMFSAKYWMEVQKIKGKQSKDETIAMSQMSEQIMEEMKQYLQVIIEGKELDEKAFMDSFLQGEKTHANQFWPKDLVKMGLNVEPIPFDYPDRIIEGIRKDGVIS